MDYIWGYFIHLGNNMWRDTWSNVEHRGPHICQATARWQTQMITDRAVWRDVVDYLPSCGVNMLGLLASPWAKTTEDNRYALLDMAHRLKYAKPLFENYYLNDKKTI